ncbi:hypothetical protein ACFVTF_03555 [Kitasatospora sp. NPDC057940]|uniref:hypothetical protein n=1 Tax=Kitasatospora sp. NPDC057940 TaxID=3346285 RepID=UPI0036DE3B80
MISTASAITATPGSEQVAFALTIGILLSAVVLVLVPVVAALLGRALWWPLRPARHHRAEPAPEPYRVPVL